MAGTRWDSATNIKFIQAYQQQVCLWDPKNPEYKNRDSRNVAYRNIKEAMDMDLTVKCVISKIRSLRNTYNSEMLKYKKSVTTLMGKKQCYKSKIPWLDSLDFLKNIDSCLRTNTDHLESQVYSADIQPIQDTSDQPSTRTKLRTFDRKRRLDGRSFILSALQRLENVSSVVNTTQQQQTLHTQDEFHFFALSIAAQLRNLPLHIAIDTQSKIQSTLSTARLSSMFLNAPSPSSSYNYNTPIYSQPSDPTEGQETKNIIVQSNISTQQSEESVPENIKQESEI